MFHQYYHLAVEYDAWSKGRKILERAYQTALSEREASSRFETLRGLNAFCAYKVHVALRKLNAFKPPQGITKEQRDLVRRIEKASVLAVPSLLQLSVFAVARKIEHDGQDHAQSLLSLYNINSEIVSQLALYMSR